MLFKAFFILSVVAIVAETGDSHKPKTTTSTSTEPPTTTTEPTTTTPLCPTYPPTYPTIYPQCCGENEIYLPPRLAPDCDVYCEDIGKECIKTYDFLKPSPKNCYCITGTCRWFNKKCIPYHEAFVKKCI